MELVCLGVANKEGIAVTGWIAKITISIKMLITWSGGLVSGFILPITVDWSIVIRHKMLK